MLTRKGESLNEVVLELLKIIEQQNKMMLDIQIALSETGVISLDTFDKNVASLDRVANSVERFKGRVEENLKGGRKCFL